MSAIITNVTMSCATLISGLGSLIGKNAAGTQLFSVPFSSAGMTQGTVSTPNIAAGDALHIAFSGIGVGLTGVVVTLDMKLGSVA